MRYTTFFMIFLCAWRIKPKRIKGRPHSKSASAVLVAMRTPNKRKRRLDKFMLLVIMVKGIVVCGIRNKGLLDQDEVLPNG